MFHSRGRAFGLVMAALGTALLAACTAPGPDAASGPYGAARGTASGAQHIPDLSTLTGLHPPQILAMLGQPDLRRDEPPAAELWQYRTADCVVNLFFYQDQGSFRLVHSEAWQRDLASSPEAGRCNDAVAPATTQPIRQSAL